MVIPLLAIRVAVIRSYLDGKPSTVYLTISLSVKFLPNCVISLNKPKALVIRKCIEKKTKRLQAAVFGK